MSKLSALLVLNLVLLPMVLIWVPLMFAMAWIREALGDLSHPVRLRVAPILLSGHDQALAALRSPSRR